MHLYGVSIWTCEGCRVVGVTDFHCTLVVYKSCKIGASANEQSIFPEIQHLSVHETVLHKASLAVQFGQQAQ